MQSPATATKLDFSDVIDEFEEVFDTFLGLLLLDLGDNGEDEWAAFEHLPGKHQQKRHAGARGAGAMASLLHSDAERRGPEIEKLVGETAKGVGGEMVGLESKYKEKDSLEHKIRSEFASHPGWTLDDVASKDVSDALRFTVQVNRRGYGAKVNSAVARLEGSGFGVMKEKNFWLNPTSGYRGGFHVQLRHRNGQKLELQFHTLESFKVTQGTHKMYERMRVLPNTRAGRAEAGLLAWKSNRAWRGVPAPS